MKSVVEPRILIACVGNIFRGDDGFGVEAARRLAVRPVPPGVTVKDFGIRGLDLAFALMDPYDFVILVDACPRGGPPGTLYVIEPDLTGEENPGPASVEGHSMNPAAVLRMVKSMGGIPPAMFVVGCEPDDLGSAEEGKLGLSETVESTMDEAVFVIERLISRIREGVLEPGVPIAAPQSR